MYVGWTVFYAVFTLVACTGSRPRSPPPGAGGREGVAATPAEVLSDTPVVEAGLEACSFFWSFYVAIGVVLFVLLYLL